MKSILVIAALAMTFAASAQGTNEAATGAKTKVAKKAAKKDSKAKKAKKEEKKSTSSLDNVEGAKVASSGPVGENQSTTLDASTAAQSTTTIEQATAEKKSPWSGSITAIAEKGWIDPTETLNSDLDTQYHFKVGYKRENGHKMTLNQRIFYSVMTNPQKQHLGDGVFGSLRTEYSIPNSIGAGGSTVIRLALPVTQAALDDNSLIGWAVMPNLSWELNPKWSLSYSGYVGGSFYGGNRKAVPAYAQDYLKDGVWQQSNIDSLMNATASQRAFVYVVNGVSFSYAMTDKLSLSQSLGYNFGLKDMSNDFAKFQRKTAAWDLGLELGYEATKNLSLSAGLSQQVADMPGSADLITGKSIFFDKYNFALFREEQTTLSMSGSYKF